MPKTYIEIKLLHRIYMVEKIMKNVKVHFYISNNLADAQHSYIKAKKNTDNK